MQVAVGSIIIACVVLAFLRFVDYRHVRSPFLLNRTSQGVSCFLDHKSSLQEGHCRGSVPCDPTDVIVFQTYHTTRRRLMWNHELARHAIVHLTHLRRLHAEAAECRGQFEGRSFVAVGRSKPHRGIRSPWQLRRGVELSKRGNWVSANNDDMDTTTLAGLNGLYGSEVGLISDA